MQYKLVYYGNETLKKIAADVLNISGDTMKLIEEMYLIMRTECGVGLAAPQIDVSQRIIAVDLRLSDGPRLALINPLIRESSDNVEPYEEGCLSLPGITAEVVRPARIFVTGTDESGKERSIEASGLLARVIQHEIDHLNGKFFIDRLEPHQKNEFRPELKNIKKLNRNL